MSAMGLTAVIMIMLWVSGPAKGAKSSQKPETAKAETVVGLSPAEIASRLEQVRRDQQTPLTPAQRLFGQQPGRVDDPSPAIANQGSAPPAEQDPIKQDLRRREYKAQAAADALRLTINEQTPRQQLKEITIATLVQHYREHEMPDVFSKKRPRIGTVCEHEEGRKSYSTQETYEGYLKKWIVPRWGSYRLGDVKAVQVEQWLKTVPLARGSRAKIRNIMSALYSHAIRWEWTDKNPITQVRQSAKRSKIPTVLSVEEIQRLFSCIKEPCRTAVILDAVSGLRVGELLGLKWEDVRFDQLELNVTRSVSRQVITPCKTEVSRKPVPMNAEIAEMLWRWRQEAPYNQPDDWIFASPHRAGIQPYWPGSLYRAHLKPALLKAAFLFQSAGTR